MGVRRLPVLGLLAVCLSPALAHSAGAQTTVVFDARGDAPPVLVPRREEALVRREVVPVARRLWGRGEGCAENFEVVDATAGSFTGRGLAQRALLYRYCETGHDFARGGIAIVQDGRVVAHLTIADAEPDGLRAIPDINMDGLWELVLVDGSTHQGETSTAVAIIQLVPGGVRRFGTAGVFADTYGTMRRDWSAEASVLYAVPGPHPRFLIETYEHRSGARYLWRGAERLHAIALERDRAVYRRER